MITLDSGDKIRGDASTDAVVDYTIYGLDNKAFKQMADGQLSDTTGDLFTADSADVVTTIILVNTHSSAVTCNLFLLPSGGTARKVIPVDCSLGIGSSLHWDGAKVSVLDASGQLLSIWAVDDTAGGTNGLTAIPVSSNVMYDHANDVDAHGEVVITTEDSGTATSADLALTMAAGEGINTTSTGSTVTITGEAASTTNIGVVELADGNETNTGTSATLAVTPDALAGSIHGSKIMYIKCLAFDTAVAVADELAYITIPLELNGMNLVLAHACVYTKSSSGLPEITLERSVDQGSNWTDMLSTSITIDENEFSSYEATTAPVIDGGQDNVATGYWIRVNVDTAGTGTKGLDVILTFRTP